MSDRTNAPCVEQLDCDTTRRASAARLVAKSEQWNVSRPHQVVADVWDDVECQRRESIGAVIALDSSCFGGPSVLDLFADSEVFVG